MPINTITSSVALGQQRSGPLGASTSAAAPSLTPRHSGNSTALASPPTAANSALLQALAQTFAQFGLAPISPTTSDPTTTSGASTSAAASTAASIDTGGSTQNPTQALQAFLGALLQATSQTQQPQPPQQPQQTGQTITTNSTATAAAGGDTSVNPSNVPALSGSNANQPFQAAYGDLGSSLSALLQQIGSGSSNTIALSTSTGDTAGTGTLATLQNNFQNLLNTASPISSQAVGIASGPSLQLFLQSLTQNLANNTSGSSRPYQIGALLETSA
jgi:hypothetical protein